MIQRPPVRFTGLAGGSVPAPPAAKPKPGAEPLIFYYSRTGTTAHVARHLASRLGADLRSLTTEDPPVAATGSWRSRLAQTLRQVVQSRQDQTLASIRGIDLAGRRLILVGSPIWLSAVAPPVAELLKSADFTGCSVVMFFTYGAHFSPRVVSACRDAIRRRGGRFLGWFAWRGGEDEAGRRHLLAQADAALSVHAASWRHQASVEVAVRRDPPTPASSLLVTLRAQGSRPPLFIVTSGHGDVLALNGLAQRLDPDQPVYALQPPIDVDPEVAGSVDSGLHRTRLARDYVEAMATLLGEDRRPVQLAGYSAGCLIAAAVADRLRVTGWPAQQLILLEPPPPLWPFDLHAFIFAKRLVRRYYPRPDRWLPRPLHVYHAYFTDDGFAHTLHAAVAYQPLRCAGHVTLVLAEDALMRFSRRRLGWRHAGLEAPSVVWVPGDHFSLLRRPHVDELGQTLRELLAPSESMERA